MFMNLNYLNFTTDLVDHEQVLYEISSPSSIVSANLLKLNIYMSCFNDCLYVLDGRFKNLHTLSITISHIHPSETIINHKVSQFFLMQQINQSIFFFFFRRKYY